MARKPVAKDPATPAAKPEVTPQNTVAVAGAANPKSIEKIGTLTRLTF